MDNQITLHDIVNERVHDHINTFVGFPLTDSIMDQVQIGIHMEVQMKVDALLIKTGEYTLFINIIRSVARQ